MKAENSRMIAADILTRLLRDGQSLTAALDNATSPISDNRDRALIKALCYGVCRQYHRLDFMLNKLSNKPITDQQIRALALIGLFQLSSMRVKPHAAVSETVLAASRKPWAKGLINALLRTYLRERIQIEHLADQVPSAAVSHPDWLRNRIENDWPEQAQKIFAENNRQPPMIVRINQTRCTTAWYLDLLAEQGLTARKAEFSPSALIFDQPLPIERLPGFAEGMVSIQDTAAQLAAPLLDLQPGQRVLDVCAAPGGKTAHILEQQPKLAAVVAVDIDPERLARIGENLLRLHLQAELICGDASKPDTWWDGRLFDRILVDAPCSALGVIRRHPDIKLLRRADDISKLEAMQQAILQAVWPLLAPGGLLLYATCSILKQENERQIAGFLSASPDAIERPIAADWGLAVEYGRQIITGESSMDGFYYARLEKKH